MSRDSLLLLFSTFIWGATFVSVKSAVQEASPILFVGVRFALATLFALPFLRWRRGAGRALWVGSLIGLAYGGGYAAQTIGLATTTPSRSAFLTGLSVAMVPIWGIAVSRVVPGLWQVAGMLLTLPGLWLLTSTGGTAGAWNQGDSWTLLCAALFGLQIALIGRHGRLHAGGLLVGQIGTSAVACLAAAPFVEEPRLRLSANVVSALALTSILATVVTTWIQIKAQPRVGSTRTALIFAVEPVWAALFSYLFWGERLSPLGWLGGALILAGMLLSEMAPPGSRAR